MLNWFRLIFAEAKLPYRKSVLTVPQTSKDRLTTPPKNRKA
jgi:hypothetical protein